MCWSHEVDFSPQSRLEGTQVWLPGEAGSERGRLHSGQPLGGQLLGQFLEQWVVDTVQTWRDQAPHDTCQHFQFCVRCGHTGGLVNVSVTTSPQWKTLS